ncbi:MAG: hypothetical protein K6F68_05035 [Clostridiales bacterium]|nr:hypothetical protein [Clostridiales bacterium]
MKRLRLTALVLLIVFLFSGNGCGIIPALIKPTAAPTETAAATPAPTETPAPTPEPTEAPEITSGEHKRESGYYAFFKTRELVSDRFTAAMEDGIFKAEDIFRIASAIGTDIDRIVETFQEPVGHVTVYVVKTLRSGGPISVEDRVFCTMADVESGDYRAALIGACLGVTHPWKQYGLSVMAFGSLDESGLKSYYGWKTNMLTASLAPVFLSPLSSKGRTLEMARNTAASITAFVMERGGLAKLRAIESTKEVLPEWQEHLGISSVIELPEKDIEAAKMGIEADLNALFIVTLGNIKVTVAENAYISSPAEIYEFVCQFYLGMEKVLETILIDDPAHYDRANTKFTEEKIDIKLIAVTAGKSTASSTNHIVLCVTSSVWHEMTHILYKHVTFKQNSAWVDEAIAQHFSMSANDAVSPYDEESTLEEHRQWMLATYGSSFPEVLTFLDLFEAVYRDLRPADRVTPEGKISERTWRKTNAIASLLLPDAPFLSAYVSVAEVRGVSAGHKSKDGNGLSYEEALAFFDYLIDTYGAETVMNGYDRPIADVCGKPYEELYREFVGYLKNRYAEYLH